MPGTEKKSKKIRVGVAGWSYRDWEGVVYPSPKPKNFDPLPFLARYVDVIEINSTFYHPAPPNRARDWASRVSGFPDFIFTAKLSRKLTHDKNDPDKRDLKESREAFDALMEAGKLGAVLVQFPWSFKNGESERSRLIGILEGLEGLPAAVEVRHESWDVEPFYELLERLGAAVVGVDQPLIGATIKPTERITGGLGYIRLHGRNYDNWFKKDAGRDARYDYLYDESELSGWSDRLKNMRNTGRTAFAIANNHYKGQALVNALQLKKMTGAPVSAPAVLLRTYPLLSDFTVDTD